MAGVGPRAIHDHLEAEPERANDDVGHRKPQSVIGKGTRDRRRHDESDAGGTRMVLQVPGAPLLAG